MDDEEHTYGNLVHAYVGNTIKKYRSAAVLMGPESDHPPPPPYSAADPGYGHDQGSYAELPQPGQGQGQGHGHGEGQGQGQGQVPYPELPLPGQSQGQGPGPGTHTGLPLPGLTCDTPPPVPRRQRAQSDASATTGNVLVNAFPAGLDYESKRHYAPRSIKKYPGKRISLLKAFKPKYAAYSHREKAFYVIVGGQLLGGNTLIKCDKEGNKIGFADQDDVKDVALTESGHVLYIQGGRHVRRLTTNGEMNNFKEQLSFREAAQICTHKDEIVVLDVGHKYLVRFLADGTYGGAIGAEKLYDVHKGSKMCIDQEGRVYVSVVDVIRSAHGGQSLCEYCKQSEEAWFTWTTTIFIFGADGDFIKQTRITDSNSWKYKLTGKVVCPSSSVDKPVDHRHKTVVSSSVHSEDHVRKHAVGGMCVDANGFMTITQPLLGRILVYNTNTDSPRCVIADPEFYQDHQEYIKEPRGVCATPDKQLVVCDTAMGLLIW